MNVFDIYERQTGLILASEDWADIYRENSWTFGLLVKAEARLNRKLLEYFRGLSERTYSFINWDEYNRRLAQINASDDFNIDVIVTSLPSTEDGLVIQITFDPIEDAVQAGVYFFESSHNIELPEETVSQIVTKNATKNVANLVGKSVDQFGNIIDAKNPKYHINQTTRDLVRKSIRTSLNLSENQKDATKRLVKIIKDPKRAAKIASTEAVNAYQGGQYDYAVKAGATKKVWQTLAGACPTCEGNRAVGEIPIKDKFPSGHLGPSAHSYDRCGLRYVFDES